MIYKPVKQKIPTRLYATSFLPDSHLLRRTSSLNQITIAALYHLLPSSFTLKSPLLLFKMSPVHLTYSSDTTTNHRQRLDCKPSIWNSADDFCYVCNWRFGAFNIDIQPLLSKVAKATNGGIFLTEINRISKYLTLHSRIDDNYDALSSISPPKFLHFLSNFSRELLSFENMFSLCTSEWISVR